MTRNIADKTQPDVTTDRINAEPMIDGREASTALCLPFYWFNDRAMRTRFRIPHYLMGGLVRYRLSELLAWAKRNNVNQQADSTEGGDAGLQ
ncbi:hypothetical protein CDEF62S_00622 [Castellaniella defragrans]